MRNMSSRHYSLGADNRNNTSAVLTPVVPPDRCSFDSPRGRMRVALSSPSSQRADEQSAIRDSRSQAARLFVTRTWAAAL
jgi:hypothetical protein